MHLPTISLLLAAVTTGACTPVPMGSAVKAAAAPMAKRAAPEPGERISPVIAFRGRAEHWDLQVENAGGYAHSVDFSWDSGSGHATGTLQYRAGRGTAASAPIVLEGHLDTAAGPRTMRVEIIAAACRDWAGQDYLYAVRVSVEAMAPMSGCGELAK